MLVLFETPAGFALFKVLKDDKLKEVDNIHTYFETPEKASKIIKLHAFKKFADTKEALKSTSKLVKGEISKRLKSFLEKNVISKDIQDEIAISDKKLAKSITEEMGIACKTGDKAKELIRGIRFQMESLLSGLTEGEMTQMSLGLAHSMSRYKLKFSTEKVDVMVIQAISLLEDLDKELNNYAMRLKEWYCWHFPELQKIVTDNVVFAQVTKAIGKRTFAKSTSLEGIVPEDIEEEIKQAAEISMGTEILDEDEKHIKTLCQQIIEISEYRASLNEYLKNRMKAIAPNLTILVGELVAAKLISHAGSLMNLAKMPASTI
jgi:nucleolar protein 58